MVLHRRPAANGFTLTHTATDDAWILHVAGELDAFSAPALRDHATAGMLGRPGAVFILDLSGVDFMDSVGLGVCTATLRRAAAMSHRVAIVAATPALQNLLAPTGIAGVYPVHRCLAEAIAAACVRPVTGSARAPVPHPA